MSTICLLTERTMKASGLLKASAARKFLWVSASSRTSWSRSHDWRSNPCKPSGHLRVLNFNNGCSPRSTNGCSPRSTTGPDATPLSRLSTLATCGFGVRTSLVANRLSCPHSADTALKPYTLKQVAGHARLPYNGSSSKKSAVHPRNLSRFESHWWPNNPLSCPRSADPCLETIKLRPEVRKKHMSASECSFSLPADITRITDRITSW